MSLRGNYRNLLLQESSFLKYYLAVSDREWVHEINGARDEKGELKLLYPRLREDEQKFFEYVRMSFQCFDTLVSKLDHSIRRKYTNYRKSIEPEQKLGITLRFLATGNSFRSLAFSFRMGHVTIRKIVMEVCKAIWNELCGIYLPAPDTNRWLSSAKGFKEKCGFPNCVGSLDGKHVRIRCPPKSGSLYFNYKKYFSIILQAVADANCKLLAIDVGAHGIESDGGVFRSSDLFTKLEQNQLSVPGARELPNTNLKIPHVLVGDEAYPLLPYLMKPYPRRELDAEKGQFNYRLSRARRSVECAFGIMTQKWQVLDSCLKTNTEFAMDIVKAVCVLHNAIIAMDGIDTDSLTKNSMETQSTVLSRSNNSSSSNARKIRDTFKQYFSSVEGNL